MGDEMRIPYKYITKSEFKNCNNKFDICNDETIHPEFCIPYIKLENKDKSDKCIYNSKCS